MTRRILASIPLAALLLGLAAFPAGGDVIHLRTGEVIKGRAVQELSNDDFVAVEDWVRGSLRRFAWSALAAPDKDAIQSEWGWANKGQVVVEGDRLVIRLQGGDENELLGLVTREDGDALWLKQPSGELRVPKSQVADREKTPLDAREIWSPDELVQRFLDDLRKEAGIDVSRPDARTHMRIADFAEWAGQYEVARTHYQAACADEANLTRELACQRVERVEAILKDQAALEALRDVKLKLHMNLFARVRAMLSEFAEANPDMSAGVQSKLDALRALFDDKRATYFQRMAARYFVKDVQRLIDDKVSDPEIPITDVTSWSRSKLPEEAFAKLAERMAKFDEQITPQEAQSFWEGRPRRPWQRVSYGAGTFVVDPPKIEPPKPSSGGGGQRPASGGAAVQIKIPKPPTRDQWWAGAATEERSSWVLAYFIERSDLFQLGDPEYRNCSLCMGQGLLHKTLQNGQTLSYLCLRCGGAQRDMLVVYR
jgi:hypothetical protein